MQATDLKVDDLVEKIHRRELRLPEMQRRYVWRAPRVRGLFDSLYRGYPSGAILVWETDSPVETRDFAVEQAVGGLANGWLLLDGQQGLTSLAAVLGGKAVKVRGRQKPIDLLFNLEHPEELTAVTEVNEDADEDEDDGSAEAADLYSVADAPPQDELSRRFAFRSKVCREGIRPRHRYSPQEPHRLRN